ncbi:MAG: MoxR family ATPase [Chloroflexi bacterium]|nr:MoxR family ATPase [Chloroflexota bacterium]
MWEQAQLRAKNVLQNIRKVIVGKDEEAELALIALLSRGHFLIEDVPGVGKTTLAKTLARSLGCQFRRIQFTPDLLPSDITGVSVYNQKTGDFEFRPGPVVAQIVLADEINRASPKTQSALLECMEERQITVDGVTHPMPRPFMVMATLNPIEYEGTFPLPEAQLDRFLLRLSLGYPTQEQEVAIMDAQQYHHPLEGLALVLTTQDVLELQEVVTGVKVDPLVQEYIARLVATTRKHASVYLGASPRGSLALFRSAQARALLRGRDFVLPDDVKSLAIPVLAHRLILEPAARMEGKSGKQVVEESLAILPVPGGRPTSAQQQ